MRMEIPLCNTHTHTHTHMHMHMHTHADTHAAHSKPAPQLV